MWNEASVLRTVALIVTGSVAAYSFVDLILEEIDHRRHPPRDRPRTRKRIGEFVVGMFGLVAFVLTWRLDALDSRQEDALRAQIASLAEGQGELDLSANAVAQARIGIRAGFETLLELSMKSQNPDVRKRVSAIVESVSTDYERSVREYMHEFPNTPVTHIMEVDGLPPPMQPPLTLPKVVSLIRGDSDLRRVALAFEAFRELTGSKVRMFDSVAVETWCHERPKAC